MKKIAILLLVFALLCGMWGCAGETGQELTDPTKETTAPVTEPESTWGEYPIITIAEALSLCGDPGNVTPERYYLRGKVLSVDNAIYGAMTLEDETGSICVYGTYSADGSVKYSELEEKPCKGDTVLLWCVLQNYEGQKEVKNARLVDFIPGKTETDASGYTPCSIADARKAPVGTGVKVEGVAARITYANGMIPSGVFLVDDTDCVYVYDSDLAARVGEGDRVTVLATRENWILDSEQANADKFGYRGCVQLTGATLVSHESGDFAFDKSWIPETTVKKILDTPVTEQITTTLFKVTALVSKVPGTGFVNYYIHDLDGQTGSYTYTQCNGSDFQWLDAFDGKICTVYLSVINAKSTAAGCVYRFLPVLVEDNGFDASSVDPTRYALDYVGVDQFAARYTGDPALELQTAVSSELLGFGPVVLSYTSSDSTVVSVEGNVLHCGKTGTATVTVTATYGETSRSAAVEITVDTQEPPVEAGSVSDAIAAQVGETVTVQGIVGPSLVNRSGFYLMDGSAVLAVLTDGETLAQLQPGHEVVLEGVRHNNTKGGSGYYGQTCLKDAVLVTNRYGSHAYSDDFFVTDKTLADFYNLDVAVDYSTTVFRMKATVTVEESQYYTNIYLTDGGTKVRLYCSGAGQYAWLKAYAGQEVTVELAPCNWNDKSYYTGCVLSIVHPDGTKEINRLNFSE